MRAAWLGERRRQQLEPVCRKLRREREKESFRASCALQAFARSLSKAFQVSKASTGYGSFHSTKSSLLDMQKLTRRTGLRLSECVCLETSFFCWFRIRKNTQNEFQTNSKHTQVAQHAGAWSGERGEGVCTPTRCKSQKNVSNFHKVQWDGKRQQQQQSAHFEYDSIKDIFGWAR